MTKPTDKQILTRLEKYPNYGIKGLCNHFRAYGYSFSNAWMVDKRAELTGVPKRVYEKQAPQEKLAVMTGTAETSTDAFGEDAPKEDEKPLAGGFVEAPDQRRAKLPGRRYVFTGAQNNTYVHKGFLAALVAFCVYNDAELIVGRFTYNKNGWQKITDDSDGVWYDPALLPYMSKESLEVAPDLVWCGELDILPTTVNPLTGLDTYSRHASSIVPHTKVQMRSVPTMKHDPAKFLYTTGAVTLRNYIQRKAGQLAEFHHVFGALYVEQDANDKWFARQLVADRDGAFYDLDTHYSGDGVSAGHRVEAISWGDIHVEKLDELAYSGCFTGTGSIASVLKPRKQFIHDLADFTARNHHNLKDPYFWAEMHHENKGGVEKGLAQCAAFLAGVSRYADETVVVESNHDQAFKRWLQFADPRFDPENAELWHNYNYIQLKWIREGKKDSVFELAVLDTMAKAGMNYAGTVNFLPEDRSYVICEDSGGIECGAHGHRGSNGSRGSPAQFRKMNRKMNTGHTHSAGIIDGVYTGGVMGKLDMGYNIGPSSWSHSHIVVYPNGKRAIITQRSNGRWRAAI